MDSGLSPARVRNTIDDDINEISEDPKISYDAEVAFDHENASLSQDSDSDEMDVDSEGTYSSLNSSSEEKSVGRDAEHELTSHYDSLSVDHNGLTSDAGDNDNGVDIEVNQLENDTQIMKDNEADEYVFVKLGAEFDSEEHAYKCYNRFALTEGFSIRKDFVNRSKVTGLVVSRRYTCHRQGYGSTSKKRDNTRKETRTGCLAHMTITRQSNGKYRVIHFETRHNHEFATPLTVRLLPSQKRISFVEAVEANSVTVPDGVPKLGMGFQSDDHAYEFYNTYAGRVGFSVRKDYVNRSRVDGAVASRRYTCYREGYRQNDKRGSAVKRPRKETRVGCMAQLVISRQSDGRYRVTHFEESHNHELVPACKVGLLRSQKKRELLLAEIEDDIYDSIDREMSLESKRAHYLSRKEAEIFRNYFRSKKLKDPSFVYCVQLDVEEEMTNLFWADEKMLSDYVDFGDVVCFDTSYLKNNDCRPFALFLGINNHKQILVFGAAFLYDDTVQSYKWLFRTFLKTMSQKIPKTVLSDKEAVITEAIVSEFPEAQHRLCAWQVHKNALKHLNQLVTQSASFTSDLCGCFFNPDEEGFVNSWKSMLDTYHLWENKELHSVLEERNKWALPYSKHIFSADIEAVLFSENSFTSLRKYLKPESHALQYVKHLGRVVNDCRYKELEANYDMGEQMPRLMGDVIMLKQVRLVYTPIIFKAFQQEYENCLNLVINQCVENVNSVEYKVSTYGQVRKYTVLCSSEDDSVACSCMKFESVGILCSHALKVLDYRNVKVVPSRYILKRWTRDARA